MKEVIVFVFFLALFELSFSQEIIDTSILFDTQYVLFDSDLAVIRTDDSLALNEFINSLSENLEYEISVHAHTDGDGDESYNEQLSIRRANTVRDFLLQYDLDSSSVKTFFHGENIPRSDNETDVGKQQNRRAVIKTFIKKKFYPIHFRIIDAESGKLIPNPELVLHSKEFRDTLIGNAAGKITTYLGDKIIVGANAHAPTYLEGTQMFKSHPNLYRDTIIIELEKFTPGTNLKFTKFFFVGNKAILLPQSKPELEKLLKIVVMNKEACFEIIRHINFPNQPAVKKNTFNFDLSIARSKHIYNYLLSNGINSSRMFFSGRGNWEMIHPNTRDLKQMQVNRRVELQVKTCEESGPSFNAEFSEKKYQSFLKPD